MDNYWKECPAKMNDGRLLTDYRTAVRREEYVKYINNIVRDDEYRLFLQANSEAIIDNEWKYYKKDKTCDVNECIHTYPTRVYPPWFVEEKTKYDSLSDPARKTKFVCAPQHDYRMSQTKKTKF
jgi:hypothetical protein